jgi:dihydroxy-acid dehydratase
VVQDGDRISINIPEGKIELLVPAEELAERMKNFVPKEPAVKTGILAKYAKLVKSASEGAVLSAE